MDWIYSIGWDREKKRPILRTIYYWFSLIIIFSLTFSAIPTLQFDGWGYDSWYMHKTLFVSFFLIGVYYIWGYIIVLGRLDKLEKERTSRNHQ